MKSTKFAIISLTLALVSVVVLIVTWNGAPDVKEGCDHSSKCASSKECVSSCASCEAVIENIMTRTSVRAYTDKAVSDEIITRIVKAGMAAPTAVNKQPWKFYVVKERALLESLGGANRNGRMVASAAFAIVVCGDMDKALENEARMFWVQDASAATENILLAAHAFGLGAVWTGVYPMEKRVEQVQKALSLPANLIPLNVIPVGYPAESPTPKDKWKEENMVIL